MAPAGAAPSPGPQEATQRGHPKTATVQAAFQSPESTERHSTWAGVLRVDPPQGVPASGQTEEAGSITSTMGEQQGQGLTLIKKRPAWGQGHPQHVTGRLPHSQWDEGRCCLHLCLVQSVSHRVPDHLLGVRAALAALSIAAPCRAGGRAPTLPTTPLAWGLGRRWAGLG